MREMIAMTSQYTELKKERKMIGKDAQVHLLEKVLEEMKRARVKVLEYGISHLVQSKTNELKHGNEMTITVRYKE